MNTNLLCRINGKEYRLAQGVTFSDEYNETLDSGTIVIPQVPQIKDLVPYDDVFIYEPGALKRKEIQKTLSKDILFTSISHADKTTFTNRVYVPKILLDVCKKTDISFDDIKVKFVSQIIGELDSNTSYVIIYDNVDYKIERKVNADSSVSLAITTINAKYSEIKWEIDGSDESGEYYIADNISNSQITIKSNEQYKAQVNSYYMHVEDTFDAEHYFYKHMLVDTYNEEMLRIENPIFTYRINVFSETKGLETVQLPSVSVTEPLLLKDKKNINEYLERFLSLYSPKVRIVADSVTQQWVYEPKYRLAKQEDCIAANHEKPISEIFADAYSPDFTLSNPTLRQLLEKLFITKDMIPYVRDGVIFAMDITQRHNAFTDDDKQYINYISGNFSSGSYADSFRTNYSNGLGQKNSCRMLENLTFRNSGTALLTMENMKIETSFPIYQVNKLTLCYYKKCYCKRTNLNAKEGEKSEENVIEYILVKHDITPFIKLHTEQSCLSPSWVDFNELIDKIGKDKNIKLEDFAKYQMCTFGYSIGSKEISGWGNKYSYPRSIGNYFSIGNIEISKIGALCLILDKLQPFGILDKVDLIAELNNINEGYSYSSIEAYSESLLPDSLKNWVADGNNINEDDYELWRFLGTLETPYTTATEGLKGLFFKMDYNAFFDGAIVHSKSFGRDGVTMNDNQSSSLALMEKDGLAQLEKLNRMGNKTLRLTARYTDLSKIKNLGDVYSDETYNDIIIYHREVSINNKVANVTYYGSKDYVLKNYFTSVYAKQRTWALMPYSESVNRAENTKTTLLLSKKKSYYEHGEKMRFNGFTNSAMLLNKIFSFANPTQNCVTPEDTNTEDKINLGYIEHEGNIYGTDINSFVSGNSMCFNIKMFDNVAAGVRISKYTAFPTVSNKNGKAQDGIINIGDKTYDLSKTLESMGAGIAFGVAKIFSNDLNIFKGSSQEWYIIGDRETGIADKLKFGIGHISEDKDGVIYTAEEIKDSYDTMALKPYLNIEKSSLSNIIESDENILKDNKDCINMTFQIELIQDGEDKKIIDGLNYEDVVFSPLMLKLSDLISQKTKLDKTTISRTQVLDTGEPIGEYDYNMLWMPKGHLTEDGRNYIIDSEIKNDKSSYKTDIYSGGSTYTTYKPSPAGIVAKIKIKKSAFNDIIIGDNMPVTWDFSKAISLSQWNTDIFKVNNNNLANKAKFNLERVVDKGSNATQLYFSLAGKLELTYEQAKTGLFAYMKNVTDTISVLFVCDKTTIDENDDYYTFTVYSVKNYQSGTYITPRFYNFSVQSGNSRINFCGKQFYFLRPQVEKITAQHVIKSGIDGDYVARLEPSEFKTQVYDKMNSPIPLRKPVKTVKSSTLTNIYVTYNRDLVNKDIVYEDLSELKGWVATSLNKKATDFFQFVSTMTKEYGLNYEIYDEEQKAPYIRINLPSNFLVGTHKSIQFWYLDNINYSLNTEGNSNELYIEDKSKASYKFIFGCNVYENDIEVDEDGNRYIKIYVSAIEQKDDRVFDSLHQPVGHIKNYADDDENYSKGQYYVV